MEDLRDVGQNSLDAINKLGASDVGDLVLGIGDLIEELYDAPEDKREGKLEHLRGLFREFAHGEEYEFRDERLEPQQPENPNHVTGMLPPNPHGVGHGFGQTLPAVSGAPSGSLPLVASGIYKPIPPLVPTQPIPPSPLPPLAPVSSSFDDDADYDDEDEEEIEEEPKEFVKRWWNTQPVADTEVETELHDDEVDNDN